MNNRRIPALASALSPSEVISERALSQDLCRAIREQVCKPNSVLRSAISNLKIQISNLRFQIFLKPSRSEIANRSGDHSSSPNITVWIKRPTRKLRASRPILKSRKTEITSRLPIWSCTARSLPGRACHHARRCALTSEISNLPEISNLRSQI